MLRRLFILPALLSTLLLAATVTLWLRSRNGGNDTLTFRTARAYVDGPALKWVVVETYDGLVLSLQLKIVPSVYGVTPPWRQDVPIGAAAGQTSYDGPVTVNFAAYGPRRTMDDRGHAEYEALVGPDYRQMPWFRWQSGPRTVFRNRAPVHPMLERLGVRRFAPFDGLAGREGYPGAYRDHRFRLPFVLPAVAFSLLPLCRVPAAWRWLRTRRRLRADRCPACGYDLRTTPWICPECGRTRVPGEGRRARQSVLSLAIASLFDREKRPRLAARAGAAAAVVTVGVVALRSPVVAGAGAPTAEGHWLRRELDRQIAAIKAEVGRLRAAGDAAGADQLADALRASRRGADDARHLHVVSLQQFAEVGSPIGHPSEQRPRGTATVHVTATDRPVVLALCGDEPVRWVLRVASGVRLERVLLEGVARQHLTGLPEGVPVHDGTAAAGISADYAFAFGHDPAYGWETRQLLRQRAGVPVRTLQARRHYGATPFIVGPGSADWQVQSDLADLRPLYLRVAALQSERSRRATAALRFYALWTEFRLPPLPAGVEAPPPPPAGLPLFARGDWCGTGPWGGYVAERSVAEFDVAGPIASAKRPLPKPVAAPGLDVRRAAWCGTDDAGGVVTFDSRTGDVAHVMAGDVGTWGGVALDRRRRRLMMVGRDSDDVYTFDFYTRRRSFAGPIGTGRQRRTPLTYSEHDDCFYALTPAVAQQGVMTTSVTRLSPDGAPQWQVPIPERVATQLLGAPQLAAAGKYLAILTPPLPDPLDPDAPRQSRCVLFDPHARTVAYSGPIAPPAGTALPATPPAAGAGPDAE